MGLKNMRLHPLVIWFGLLGGTVALAALGMGLLVLAPNSMGLTDTSYQINSAFSFDEWEISTRHGIISFPEGGLAVEAYQHDRLAAFVIWGTATLDPIDTELDVSQLDNIQLTVVYMSEKELLSARGSTYIRTTDSPDGYQQAAELLKSEKHSLPLLRIFGNQRIYPFPSGVARAVFFDSEGQRYIYQDGGRVSLQGPDGQQYLAPEVPVLVNGLLATILYTCCIIILLIATFFATLGNGEHHRPGVASPGKTNYYLLLAPLYALGRGLVASLQLGPLVTITYDSLLLFLAVYLLNKQALQRQLPPRSLLSRLGLGLLLGGLAVFLGQLALPRGLTSLELGDYILLIGGGLAMALAQETLWRGLVLEHLIQRWGNWRGLFLTAGFQGLCAFLTWLLNPVSALGPLNTLVFISLQALWLGYTYLRTNNLTTPMTISACLAVLPQLLVFY
ncbi:MAG: CPBP family intramembrane metalloprotease [Firmicutes bacterium]|nr:CPBP family intramembrane metalloprotease [Bacillota bacterium]